MLFYRYVICQGFKVVAEVQLNEQGTPQCTCNKFQNLGIPYFHMICYLNNSNIREVPSSLIVDGWKIMPNGGSGQTEISEKENQALMKVCELCDSIIINAQNNGCNVDAMLQLLTDNLQSYATSPYCDLTIKTSKTSIG